MHIGSTGCCCLCLVVVLLPLQLATYLSVGCCLHSCSRHCRCASNKTQAEIRLCVLCWLCELATHSFCSRRTFTVCASCCSDASSSRLRSIFTFFTKIFVFWFHFAFFTSFGESCLRLCVCVLQFCSVWIFRDFLRFFSVFLYQRISGNNYFSTFFFSLSVDSVLVFASKSKLSKSKTSSNKPNENLYFFGVKFVVCVDYHNSVFRFFLFFSCSKFLSLPFFSFSRSLFPCLGISIQWFQSIIFRSFISRFSLRILRPIRFSRARHPHFTNFRCSEKRI